MKTKDERYDALTAIIADVFVQFEKFMPTPPDRQMWRRQCHAWAPVAATRIIEYLDNSKETQDIGGKTNGTTRKGSKAKK